MNRTKKISVLIITIIMLLGSLSNVKASSFKFSTIAEKGEVEVGDTVKIDMQISKIEAEDGINVVEADLEYDKTVFESVTFENSNEWMSVYNSESGDKEGKFIVTKQVEGVTQKEKIGQIQLKLKDNTQKNETEIKIKNITSNNGTELIDEGSKTIKIKIINHKKDDKKDEIQKGEQDSLHTKYEPNNQGNKKNEGTNHTGSINSNLATGDIIVPIVVAVIVLIIINLLYFMIKAKRLTKEEGKEKYVKRMIALVVISLLLMIMVVFLAKDAIAFEGKNIEEIIEILKSENKDNPESSQYLITDKTISRIKPETTIQKLQTQLENVTVENHTDTEFVKTGMMAQYEKNGRSYEISVLGDINGDGILNQIDLTRQIREYLKCENWIIQKDIEKLSADITCDGKIDEQDINSIVNYIVYGKLEVKKVEPVKAPKIEIIAGKEENGKYISSATVKITQENEEAKTAKTIYEITGSKTTQEKEISNKEEIIELKGVGVYKITSYTYGMDGNKSKGSESIIVIEEIPEFEIDTLTWSNEKVKVTIGEKEGFKIEYKINNGEWNEYLGEFEVEENCTITARLISIEDENIISREITKEITNIDKVEPTGNIQEIEKKSNIIKVKVQGQDQELSGIDTMKIYIKEAAQGEYECVKTYEYGKKEEDHEVKEEIYDIKGLKAKTTYKIYMEVTDRAGNSHSTQNNELEIETLEEPDLMIKATPEEWTKEKVKVIIDEVEGYDIEYKTENEEWKKYTKELEIEENCVVTARLSDQVKEEIKGKEVTKEIKNIDKVNPTGSIEEIQKRADVIKVKVQGQDQELSGIDTIKIYAKEKAQTKYNCVKTFEYTEEEHERKEEIYNIEGLKAETTYKIYMEVTDKAGNSYSTQNNELEIKTLKVPDVIIEATPDEEWTNGKVRVTMEEIEGYEEGYKIQYKINNGEWAQYVRELEIQENCLITAKLITKDDEEINSKEATKQIANIDKVEPTGNIQEIQKKSNIIKVKVQGQDQDLSGIDTIKIYIKEAAQGEYECVKTYEYAKNGEDHEAKEEIYDIKGIKAKTTYKIYMEVTDRAGNNHSTQNNELEIETLEEPDLMIKETPKEWTNGNVTVTMDEVEGYEIEYKIDNGEWEKYTKELEVEENCIITARLSDQVKEEIKGKEVIKEITNIDKKAPIGKIERIQKRANSIKVKVQAQEQGLSGIDTMKIYVKEATQGEYHCVKTYEYEENQEQKEEIFNIEGLQPETTYKIYMEVTDKAGNSYSNQNNELEIKTLKEADVFIDAIPDEEWTNGKVKVTMDKIEGYEEGYNIQYKINSGEWIEYLGEFDIEENCIITAVLVSEENEEIKSKEVIKEITNIDKENPTGSIEEIQKRADVIKVKVQGQDQNLSGINTIKIYLKEATQGQYNCVKTYEYGENGEDYESKEEVYHIEGLKAETTYKIYMDITDKAGNNYSTQNNELEVKTLKEPNIIIETTPEEWTKENVTATLTMPEGYQEEGYHIEYILRQGQVTEEIQGWITYQNGSTITIEENTTIQARLTKGDIKEKIISKQITNIDKVAPVDFTPKATATSHSITLSGSTTDAAQTDQNASTGIEKYYFSKDNGVTWEPTEGQTQTSYTFENLTQKQAFSLRMKAVDKVGNERITRTVNGTTKAVPILNGSNVNFGYSHTNWTNNEYVEVTIEITNQNIKDTYTLEYSTDRTNWQEYTEAIKMYQNGEIYTRVIDSTRQTGNNSQTGYATARVNNIDKIEPNQATIQLSKTKVELGKIPLEEQAIDYTETLETFNNPERGFYNTAGLSLAVSGNKATNPTAKLTHLRVGIGKFSRAFNGYQDLEFTQDALNALNQTLANARRNGCSVIIRFAYDNYEGRGNLEPSMDMILRHISQLKPVFEANQDVIAYIELGLFGKWGEMHGSSMCTTDNVNRALDAMLDSAPEKIKIGVRTPNYYAKWVGIDRADLDKHVAQKGTREYRVGLFNDGYLGSGNDLGTFADREKEITWLEKQAMHTFYGGEVVANANPSNVPAINTAAYMSQEAFRTHTTYLNAEWNNTVINSWKNETYNGNDNLYRGQTGYTYITNHLGYRFVLRKSAMPKSITQSQELTLNLDLENVGFANLINSKVVSIVLEKDNEKYEIKTDLDPTTWNSTEITKLTIETQLPNNISLGEWKVYLRISSQGNMNTDNNYQCIRLANKGNMWNQTIGANYIGKFNVVEKDESGNITAKVTLSDGQSGIDITKCKWVYTKDSGEIGTTESRYTGGTLNTNPENITLENTKTGTYYLHILTVDKAGNKKETISDPIMVVEAPQTEDSIRTTPRMQTQLINLKQNILYKGMSTEEFWK